MNKILNKRKFNRVNYIDFISEFVKNSSFGENKKHDFLIGLDKLTFNMLQAIYHLFFETDVVEKEKWKKVLMKEIKNNDIEINGLKKKLDISVIKIEEYFEDFQNKNNLPDIDKLFE